MAYETSMAVGQALLLIVFIAILLLTVVWIVGSKD